MCPPGCESKGGIQFCSGYRSLLDIEPLENSLAKQAFFVVISFVKEKIQLSGQLQGYLEIGLHQMLALCYEICGGL